MSGDSIGGFSGPYTVDPTTRVRSHAGSAYYKPAAERKNLVVRTEVLVEKLVLGTDEAGELQAKGVLFSSKNERRLVRACKEVVLAAGVFQTPQLLELSRVGSPEILELHGIEVVRGNEDVRENLQDHAMTGLYTEVAEDVPTGDVRRDPKFKPKPWKCTRKAVPVHSPPAFLPSRSCPSLAGPKAKTGISICFWAMVRLIIRTTKSIDPPAKNRLNLFVR